MKTVLTSASVIEAMSFRSGRPIEIHGDRAYYSAGGVTWWAILPAVGGAA